MNPTVWNLKTGSRKAGWGCPHTVRCWLHRPTVHADHLYSEAKQSNAKLGNAGQSREKQRSQSKAAVFPQPGVLPNPAKCDGKTRQLLPHYLHRQRWEGGREATRKSEGLGAKEQKGNKMVTAILYRVASGADSLMSWGESKATHLPWEQGWCISSCYNYIG